MRALALASLLAAAPGLACAGELVEGFQKALAADAAYQAARAELSFNQLTAERAGRAYYPELGVRAGERSEVQGFQTTIQLSQPLVDADRYATWRSAQPLEDRAQATMRQREAELLQRYYKAVADLVRAREQLRLHEAKAEALQAQASSAKRGLALGAGTRTDVYDTEVRLALARAEALTLRANRDAAERQYRAYTGEPSPKSAFSLALEQRLLVLDELTGLMQRAERASPQIVALRQTERIAELDVTRKYGAFLPRLNAIARRSRVEAGENVTYVGLAFELPLQSGSFVDVSVAKAAHLKASEDVHVARQTLRLDLQRLYELVANGRQELPIRLEAIEAARLGLEASEKSLKGGVRTQVDVLNSIQTLFQTQDDYVAAVLNLGLNYVALYALLDTPSTEVLGRLERFLF